MRIVVGPDRIGHGHPDIRISGAAGAEVPLDQGTAAECGAAPNIANGGRVVDLTVRFGRVEHADDEGRQTIVPDAPHS